MLALTSDGEAPAAIARLLTETGFGASRLTLLEALGGPRETIRQTTAQTFNLGTVDPHGFVKLLDRKKDMIIVSGFKVFPNEVEEVVAQHPGVLEAAAIGVPDARSGQAVKLFVVRRDPALTEAALRAYCHDNLTGYKVPRLIEFRDQLPKSNIGKILRKELH